MWRAGLLEISVASTSYRQTRPYNDATEHDITGWLQQILGILVMGNGSWVMSWLLTITDYRLITHHFFKELANPHRKHQRAEQDELSEFQVSNAAYSQIYRVHSWV